MSDVQVNEAEDVMPESKTKTKTKVKNFWRNVMFLGIVGGVIGLEFQSYQKRIIIGNGLIRAQTEISELNSQMKILSEVQRSSETTSIKLKESLMQIPSLEGKITSLNELVISKLSKDQDKLNLAISYLDDAIRYVRKMATWNFATEAIQLVRFNLLQYPDYIEELTQIQNELEGYHLEPWYRLVKITAALNVESQKNKDNAKVKLDDDSGSFLEKSWHKLKDSIKVSKVKQLRQELTVADSKYLLAGRLHLSLEEAAYAVLTDRNDIYQLSLDKSLDLLSLLHKNSQYKEIKIELESLKNYKSPVQRLINKLEMIKANIVSQQEGDS
ncbi:MAG: hypothetical protein HON32_02330 [Francisellaceae bacterium]|jgi:hypothetical protein|nr:hypothetical protein [Francisellaceae bacterium]MBT6538884.1 hypothetical protein [Francisellaceae bacterium]